MTLNKLLPEDIDEKIMLNEKAGVDIYRLKAAIIEELKEFLHLPPTMPIAFKGNPSNGGSIRALPKTVLTKEIQVCKGYKYLGTSRQTPCTGPRMQGSDFCRDHKNQANPPAVTDRKKKGSTGKKPKGDDSTPLVEEEITKVDVDSLKEIDADKHLFKDIQMNFAVYYNAEESPTPQLVGIFEGVKVRLPSTEESANASKQGYEMAEKKKVLELYPELYPSEEETTHPDKPKKQTTRKSAPPPPPIPSNQLPLDLEVASDEAKVTTSKGKKKEEEETKPTKGKKEEEHTKGKKKDEPKPKVKENDDEPKPKVKENDDEPKPKVKENDDEEEIEEGDKTEEEEEEEEVVTKSLPVLSKGKKKDEPLAKEDEDPKEDEYKVPIPSSPDNRRGLPRLSATKARNRNTPTTVKKTSH